MRRIVCAANRHKIYGIMVLGVRHFDMQMHMTINKFDLLGLEGVKGGKYWDQGFIDNKGMFQSRKEALEIAKAANQLIRKTQPEDELFSEDLY